METVSVPLGPQPGASCVSGSLRLGGFPGGEAANLSPSCEQLQHTPHEESHFSSLDPLFYITSSRKGLGHP